MTLSKSEAGKLGAIKSTIVYLERKNKLIEEYNKNPNLCLNCKKPKSYNKRKNKCCCASCAAIYSNHKKLGLRSKIINCLFCNKEKRVGKDSDSKFCCKLCLNLYKKQNNFAIIKDKIEKTGCVSEPSNNGNDGKGRKEAKKYLLYKYGHKCMNCGIDTWLGIKVPLVCDHIDGNHNNCNISNFRLICNNCDSISNTFKARNKNSNRKYRRNKVHSEVV